MSKIFRLARRAATASPHEWWTRGSQLAFACQNYLASRSGASALSSRGHLRSLGIRSTEVSEWWSARRDQWFVTPERIEYLRRISETEASEIPWILQRADDVLGNRLPLFGYGVIDYSAEDRWHQDVILKKTAPQMFHGRVPYLDPNVVGDSKHVWEPNRFAWAIWLGIAYRVTNDERYAEKFREMTTDWFNRNPYPLGINYCSALELAFRNYAWLWSLSLFSEYLDTQPQLLERLLCGIWTASRHVEINLSTYFAPNTHILGEAFGLFAVGAAIPEFRDSARWRKLGLSLLQSESKKQFYHDGMHRELSGHYHIYSTDFLLHTVQIGRESGFRVPTKIEATAKRAARRLSEIVPHDLKMPQFNDCDGGRLMNLVPYSFDAGPTLTAANAMFPQESLLPSPKVNRGYPLLMLPFEKTPSRAVPRRQSKDIPIDRDLHRIYDSGIAAYRTQGGDYALLRATDFGYHDCPHSHDAGLGILLHLNHVPVFVDSGVGSYTQSEACRNTFRSATGKNTILVNGRGPSECDGWFTWKTKTDCELVSMRQFADGFSARGKHGGFSDFNDCHTCVQREIIVLETGIIAIVDRWDADRETAVQSRFTLNPALAWDPVRKMLQHHNNETFHLLGVSLNGGEDVGILHNEEAFSPEYGIISKTTAVSLSHPTGTRGGIVTFVSRCGPATHTNRTVKFQGEDFNVQFEITPSGVQLSKNEELTSA